MKKIIFITAVCLLSIVNLDAQEVGNLNEYNSPYQNLREGKSHFITKYKIDDVRSRYKNTEDLIILREVINDKKINRCATKVIASLQNKLGLYSEVETEMAVLGLRLDESIDDIAAGILIKAIKPKLTNTLTQNDLTIEEESSALEIYKEKVADLQNKSLCIEDTYREVVTKLTIKSKKYLKSLKYLNTLALNNKIIKADDFKAIEKMRTLKVYEWPITLNNYRSNLDLIAKAFPNRLKDSSQAVTDVAKFRSKSSLRQSLHEKFNGAQILMLANAVKILKKRLDSTGVAVHINYVDEQSEIIILSPMEKFRFILKLLRKELATLNNGTLLKNQKASYIDLITAAYEVGYISSMEIEQFFGLEDIWNPKKTTKEKVTSWVKMFGGVSAVFLPPPFGFLSVMAIMLIDQQILEAPVNTDSDFNLL